MCCAGVQYCQNVDVTTFRKLPPHSFVVQSQPGVSARLHHEFTLDGSAATKVATGGARRPTHANHMQLLMDIAVAGMHGERAWAEPTEDVEGRLAAKNCSPPRQPPSRKQAPMEDKPVSGFCATATQVAAIEVCFAARVSAPLLHRASLSVCVRSCMCVYCSSVGCIFLGCVCGRRLW
jgi:hypothetical protein